MQLWAGLGNPGQRYAGNRHNIGFLAVDAIARKYGFGAYRSRFQGLIAEGEIAGEKLLILKPQTMMNLSGISVSEAANFYKIPLDRVVVFHDELALAFAKVRVKIGGGTAGHNGLKSLDAHLGNGFKRVRIGIDHPGHKDLVSPYVLSDFLKEERPVMEKLVEAIVEAAPDLAKGDDSGFMNKIALAVPAEAREI